VVHDEEMKETQDLWSLAVFMCESSRVYATAQREERGMGIAIPVTGVRLAAQGIIGMAPQARSREVEWAVQQNDDESAIR